MRGVSAFSRASVLAFASLSKPQQRGIASTSALSATQYLLSYQYIPDVLEKRGPYREEHLQLAQTLADEGKCLAGGPTGPLEMKVPTGALFLFTERKTAEEFVTKDPYVSAGIVTSHNIQEWNVVIQKES